MNSPLNAQQLSRYLNTFTKVNSLMRFLLKLSIGGILISGILVVTFENLVITKFDYFAGFIYIAILSGIWVGNLSIATIIITAILRKLDKRPIWISIKQEMILLLGLLLSFGVFYLCGVWVYGA